MTRCIFYSIENKNFSLLIFFSSRRECPTPSTWRWCRFIYSYSMSNIYSSLAYWAGILSRIWDAAEKLLHQSLGSVSIQTRPFWPTFNWLWTLCRVPLRGRWLDLISAIYLLKENGEKMPSISLDLQVSHRHRFPVNSSSFLFPFLKAVNGFFFFFFSNNYFGAEVTGRNNRKRLIRFDTTHVVGCQCHYSMRTFARPSTAAAKLLTLHPLRRILFFVFFFLLLPSAF